MSQIVDTSNLTDLQFSNARTLAENCNTHDSLDYLHMIKAMADIGHHFQLYDQDVLVGLLTFPFDGNVHTSNPEALLVVDPAHRRKGIGSQLVGRAKDYWHSLGVNSYLLACEDKSASGNAFLKAVGGEFSHSELRLRLENKLRQLTESTVSLRLAKLEDLDLLVRLLAKAFDDPIEAHIPRLLRDLPSTHHRFYLGSVNQNPIGCIGVVGEERRAYVIAFGIIPEHRGRGYGRQMLSQTANSLLTENWHDIFIEVDSTNQVALSLYETCGFNKYTSYNYYKIKCDG